MCSSDCYQVRCRHGVFGFFYFSASLPGLFVDHNTTTAFAYRHDQRYLAEKGMRLGTTYSMRGARLSRIGHGQSLRPFGVICSGKKYFKYAAPRSH